MFAYRPHPLLRSGHLQTIVGSLVTGKLPACHADRICIPVSDGECLIVNEQHDSHVTEESPIAILVHGLGGCAASPYVRRISHALKQSRTRCWRVNLRGAGEGISFAYRPAHAASSEDLAAIVAEAQRRFPDAQILMAGFSLGGNIMLKMLGEAAAGCLRTSIDLSRIGKAMAIAPPVNLEACSCNMERFSRRLYTQYYLGTLAKQVQERAKCWPQWRAISQHPRVRTIRQFDARYTVPLGGFESTREYYAVASSDKWLDKITTPTKLLVDRHDPIVPLAMFKSVTLSPHVTLELTSYGGHLGYVGIGSEGQLLRWLDHWVVEQIRAPKMGDDAFAQHQFRTRRNHREHASERT